MGALAMRSFEEKFASEQSGGGGGGGANSAAAVAPTTVPPRGDKMRLAIDGFGKGGAIRIFARGGAGWEGKAQMLFVSGKEAFDRERLHELLMALTPVLNFELVDKREDV